MAWTTPKTNWVSSDYYNYGDLNKVESNTDELNTIITSLVPAPTLGAIVTNRTNVTLEYYDSLNRVESNILALKTAFYEPLGWITPKTDWVSLQAFDNIDANRLESNLLALKTMTDNVIAEFEYCGSITCGEVFNFDL